MEGGSEENRGEEEDGPGMDAICLENDKDYSEFIGAAQRADEPKLNLSEEELIAFNAEGRKGCGLLDGGASRPVGGAATPRRAW